MGTTIRPATPADAARLSAFGARTFDETFGPDNSPADMAAFLAATYTPARQAAEIADPGAVVLLAEDADAPGHDPLVGYAYLGTGPAPAAVAGRDALARRVGAQPAGGRVLRQVGLRARGRAHLPARRRRPDRLAARPASGRGAVVKKRPRGRGGASRRRSRA